MSEAPDSTKNSTARIGQDGTFSVPIRFLQELGVGPGDTLLLEIVDGELRLVPQSAIVRRAQELTRSYIPEDVSLVDEFIAERRAEAERE